MLCEQIITLTAVKKKMCMPLSKHLYALLAKGLNLTKGYGT